MATVYFDIFDLYADAARVEIKATGSADLTVTIIKTELILNGQIIQTYNYGYNGGYYLTNLIPQTTYTLGVKGYTNTDEIVTYSADFATPEEQAPSCNLVLSQTGQNLICSFNLIDNGNFYGDPQIVVDYVYILEYDQDDNFINEYGYNFNINESLVIDDINLIDKHQYKARIWFQYGINKITFPLYSNTVIGTNSATTSLPIHVSIDGQAFQHCPVVKISVDGGDFKLLTSNALKII